MAASPQPKPVPLRPSFGGFRSLKANFTTVPNQYFDRVVGHYHPCVERVVGILIRATLGWEDPDTGERRLEAELALKDFVRPELSECSARRGIAGAIEAGFVICTLEATTREPARYALRWEDAAAQRSAITRQRKAHGTARRRGGRVAAPAWKKRWIEQKQRGKESGEQEKQGSHGDTSHYERSHRERSHGDTSSLNRESEKKSSPEKKQSFKKGLASPGRKEEEPDILGSLAPDEWAALEAEARARVIAENGNPVRELARRGKAMERVRAMMRTLLAERVPVGEVV